MHQPTLDKPPFPKDFDPNEAFWAYLRSHQAGKVVLLIVGLLALFALFKYPAERQERDDMQAMLDAAPFDDEPVDDEDRAAIAEARNDTSFVSLDAFLGRAS